jgi:UDPglucose 6-dehydrogenase
MVIGVIGSGVVGGSLIRWFKEFTNHSIKIYDPAKGYEDDLLECDTTFICVPAPTLEDGQIDLSIVEESVSRSGGITFIKSTVVPGTNDMFGTYSCPEFLTERIAYDEMIRMDVLSGYNDIDFMEHVFKDKKIHIMKNVECELAKYAHNVFGAMKVNFFNTIYQICSNEGASYDKVLNGILLSGYINKVHTRVPGPDGQFGYGGACFPKDIKAFNYQYPTLSFSACMTENHTYRNVIVSDQ